MPKERILIAAKTYPTLSRKYGETVCTAGVREDGSWVRLYPVPFRRLDETQQYKKFDWIECEIQRRTSDPRPESCRPMNMDDFRPVGHVSTGDNWRERRRLILKTARVFSRLNELIDEAKANRLSLAVFKPASVLDFTWMDEDREWDIDKVRLMREEFRQLDLFEDNTWRNTFKLIKSFPSACPIGSRMPMVARANCRCSTGKRAPSTGIA